MRTLKCHNRITNLFDNIRDFFEKTVPNWIDQHVAPILHFVEGLKAIEEGVAFTLTALFPNISADLFKKIDASLDEICQALRIEMECAIGADGKPASLEQRLACIAKYLSSLHPELRHALEIKLASWLTRITAGEHQFTPSQIDAIVQFEYSHTKHDTAAVPDSVISEIKDKKTALIEAIHNLPPDAISSTYHPAWNNALAIIDGSESEEDQHIQPLRNFAAYKPLIGPMLSGNKYETAMAYVKAFLNLLDKSQLQVIRTKVLSTISPFVNINPLELLTFFFDELDKAPDEAFGDTDHEFWTDFIQKLQVYVDANKGEKPVDEVKTETDIVADAVGKTDVTSQANPTNAPDEALMDPSHEHWTKNPETPQG